MGQKYELSSRSRHSDIHEPYTHFTAEQSPEPRSRGSIDDIENHDVRLAPLKRVDGPYFDALKLRISFGFFVKPAAYQSYLPPIGSDNGYSYIRRLRPDLSGNLNCQH